MVEHEYDDLEIFFVKNMFFLVGLVPLLEFSYSVGRMGLVVVNVRETYGDSKAIRLGLQIGVDNEPLKLCVRIYGLKQEGG